MAAVAAINNMGSCAHNPRGNLWFNDETTYGHKLLMKMGWSKGKGLGKNEDGIQENLSVKFKNTNSGLGYKDDPYSNIMKTEYESILKNLNANYPQKGEFTVEKEDDKLEDKSCEQRSKVVKGRPRYPRLFFGKDVNKYSEKDMKSIFICSLPSKDNQEVHEGSAISQKEESQLEFPQETKTSTLSISDYFAKKMKKKKNKVLAEETTFGPNQEQAFIDSKVTKTRKRISEVDSDEESGNDSNEQQTTVTGAGGNSIALFGKKSSSKKKRKTEIITDGTDSVDICDLETDSFVPKKKKQKHSGNLITGSNVSKIEISDTGETSHFTSIPNEKRSKVFENKNSSVKILANEGELSEKSTDKTGCVDICDLETGHRVPNKKKRILSENLICKNISIGEHFEPSETSSKSIPDKKRKSKVCENENSSSQILANGDKISEIDTNRRDSGDICDLDKKCVGPNKNKQKLLGNLTSVNSVSKIEITEIGEMSSIKSISHKKRRKSKVSDNENRFSETFANNGKISCQIELSPDRALQLKKKRKKYKNGSLHTDTSELALNNSQVTNYRSSSKSAEGEQLNNGGIFSKKKKKKKFKKLKSCLKIRSCSYSTKNVSFSEHVSYHVIDSDCESFQNLSEECSKVQNVLINKGKDSIDAHKNKSDNSILDTRVIGSDNHKSNHSHTDVENKVSDAELKKSSSLPESCAWTQERVLAEEKGDILSSSLPSSESPYYNSWVESQKQALKMKMYKNMLKSIKEHEILKTSSLLSIKGYGNCGFK